MAITGSGRGVGSEAQRVETLVIGGGQAGLAIGHELRAAGSDVQILDASPRIGDAWRNRWDSLRLFTPARMNGLPGMRFPGPGDRFVSKDEVADFLESYAERMGLPVRSGIRVDWLSRQEDEFIASTSHGQWRARNVVVAMADYQKPKVPWFAGHLDPRITQMHSTGYRNPGQLQDGPVLVVGLGNSGADIAVDVAPTHRTLVSGTESSAVPFRLESWFGRTIGTRMVRFAAIRVLTTSTPIGRRARPTMLTQSAPLVRVRPKELQRAGVERVGRITGVADGLPVTSEGVGLEVTNVIWCTGYRPGFDWIDLDVFDEQGRPRHDRGIVTDEPGLYFLGLFFLHALWSETIPGVQIDARHIAKHIATTRMPTTAAQTLSRASS